MRYFILAVLLAASTPLKPISIQPHGALFMAQMSGKVDVMIEIIVPPKPDNREFTITVDGPEYYSESSQTLNGDEDHPRFRKWFKDVPTGEYGVQGALRTSDGKFTQAESKKFTVVGPEGIGQ